MSIFKNCKLINTLSGEVKEPVDISPFEISDEKKKKIDNMRAIIEKNGWKEVK